jgi:hypothetical protein
MVCLELNGAGLPDGCDRTFATSPVQMPAFQQPVALTILFETQGGNGAAEAIEEDARRSLMACYADVSILPRDCESDYMNRVVSIWNNSWMTSQDLERLRRVVDNFTIRFGNTENSRELNQFVSNIDLSFSFYNIGIGSGFLSNLLIYDQYNQALVAARQQRLCQLWYRNWDANNCGA